MADNESQDTQNPGGNIARFTIHVPDKNMKGEDIPHVLAFVRQLLSSSGLHGRTVIKSEGDWQGGKTPVGYDTQRTSLVIIDAPDTPETFNIIQNAAHGIKELADYENIYITKHPLETYLV